MSEPRPSVLVPVAVLRGETISEAVIELLSAVDVTLLGYHVIPEQTATEQAHDQFHRKVERKLNDYVELFDEYGGSVTTRSVFTHNATTTFERIAVDEAADSILLLNPAPAAERILVPIRGEVNIDRIVQLTAAIATGSDPEIVLFHVAKHTDDREAGREILSHAAEALSTAGVDADRITQQIDVSDSPLSAIAAAAEETDLVVIGEKAPSIIDRILGDVATRIADSSLSPVLVVRKNATNAAE